MITPPPLSELQSGAVLPFNKPLNWTSFDVVNYIKKSTGVKVGHAGTLDPLATGLLVICTGSFTKKTDMFQAQEKEYTGSCIIGAGTPSHDLETTIDETFPTSHLTDAQILQEAANLTGELFQMAPAFSAKKINGVRAYEKARLGEEVKIKENLVTVPLFEITCLTRDQNGIRADFRIVCSKGTYIRSLVRDLGKNLSNAAHLTALCRTRIGEIYLNNAITLEAFREAYPVNRLNTKHSPARSFRA